MQQVLATAMAEVMRDLVDTSGLRPRVADDQWSDVPGQITATLSGLDGSGQGIYVLAGAPLPVRIASLADQVQDWAVEELWREGRPATWPECPQHPGSHPLATAVDGERAVWRCPKSDRVFAEIGSLDQDLQTDTAP